jgi:hypothetical protein
LAVGFNGGAPSYFRKVYPSRDVAPKAVKYLPSCLPPAFIFGGGINRRHMPLISGVVTGIKIRHDAGTRYNFSFGHRYCLNENDIQLLGLKAGDEISATMERGYVTSVQTGRARVDFIVASRETGEIIRTARQQGCPSSEGALFISNLPVRKRDEKRRYICGNYKQYELPQRANNKTVSVCIFHGQLLYWRYGSFGGNDRKAAVILLQFYQSPAKGRSINLLQDFVRLILRLKMSEQEFIPASRMVLKACGMIDASALKSTGLKQMDDLTKDLAKEFFRRRISRQDRRLSGTLMLPLKAALKRFEESGLSVH